MTFDKWFNKQSIILKAILMLIPGVNWVCELLIRGSVALRTKSLFHILILVLFLVVNTIGILGIIDFIYMLITGHLLFAD